MFNLDFYKQKEEKIVKIYTVIKVATIVMAILAMVFVNHILTKERNSAEKIFRTKCFTDSFKFKRQDFNIH